MALRQGQLSVTASAQQITSTGPNESIEYSFKAPAANVATVYIGIAGVTTSTGYPVEPGEEFVYGRQVESGQSKFDVEIAAWYAIGTSGDKLAWLAHPQ